MKLKRRMDFGTWAMWVFPITVVTGPVGLILWTILCIWLYDEYPKEQKRKKQNQIDYLLRLNDPKNMTDEEKDYVALHPDMVKIRKGRKDEPAEGEKVDIDSPFYPKWVCYRWELEHYPKIIDKYEYEKYQGGDIGWDKFEYICKECGATLHNYFSWKLGESCNDVKSTLWCPHCHKDVEVFYLTKEDDKIRDDIHYYLRTYSFIKSFDHTYFGKLLIVSYGFEKVAKAIQLKRDSINETLNKMTSEEKKEVDYYYPSKSWGFKREEKQLIKREDYYDYQKIDLLLAEDYIKKEQIMLLSMKLRKLIHSKEEVLNNES